jgi:hypothetical protein
MQIDFSNDMANETTCGAERYSIANSIEIPLAIAMSVSGCEPRHSWEPHRRITSGAHS